MHDTISRLQRRRLSRYAPPDDPVRRRVRWIWPLLALWLAWIGVVSDHSFYRIWRLTQEKSRVHSSLERTQSEIDRLDRETRDPAWSRDLAERMLRERDGMARSKEIVYRIEPRDRDSLRR